MLSTSARRALATMSLIAATLAPAGGALAGAPSSPPPHRGGGGGGRDGGCGDQCSDPQFRDSYACRQLILQYDSGFDERAVLARYPGLTLIGLIPQLGQAWLRLPADGDLLRLTQALARELGVVRVERNGQYLSPECRQLNIPILDLTVPPRPLLTQPALRAMHAEPEAGFGGGVLVAILDTGVSRTHPDLEGALVSPGIDMVAGSMLADDIGNGIDDDGDGVLDVGWGHGTMVAGLIHLVAPGARILPVRVLDDECQGSAFALAAGIVKAVDAGARIINASLGARESSYAVREALQYAADRGVLIVAAAGNRERGAQEANEVQFPARDASCLAIAAVDAALVAAPFTVHDHKVGMSAPGIGVIAAWRAGHGVASGTSFSTALASGAAAVALGTRPWLDRLSLIEALATSAIPVDAANPTFQGELGEGVPDVAALARTRATPQRAPAQHTGRRLLRPGTRPSPERTSGGVVRGGATDPGAGRVDLEADGAAGPGRQ